MKKKENLPPTILFIFGGSGDLANRKLIPALYNLFIDDHLPEKFIVIGVGRTPFPDEEYRNKLLEGVKEFSRRQNGLEEKWTAFAPLISYHEMDLTSDESYQKMRTWILEKNKEWGVIPNVIFYLAVAPQMTPDIS